MSTTNKQVDVNVDHLGKLIENIKAVENATNKAKEAMTKMANELGNKAWPDENGKAKQRQLNMNTSIYTDIQKDLGNYRQFVQTQLDEANKIKSLIK